VTFKGTVKVQQGIPSSQWVSWTTSLAQEEAPGLRGPLLLFEPYAAVVFAVSNGERWSDPALFGFHPTDEDLFVGTPPRGGNAPRTACEILHPADLPFTPIRPATDA